MLVVLVRNTRRARGALPARSSSRIVASWLLGTIVLTVVVLLLFLVVRNTNGFFRSGEEVRLPLLILVYALVFASALYLWRWQRESTLLRRGSLLALCSVIPIVVY